MEQWFKEIYNEYNMTDSQQILIQFKNSLVSFVDQLIEAFNQQEPNLIVLRIFLQNQIPVEDVMNKFIHLINKDNQQLKKDIKDRNEESVFIKNDIFEAISKSKALNFQNLWRSNMLDEEERANVWKWIDSFVILADRYSKNKSLNL